MPYQIIDQGDPNEAQAQVPVIDVPTTDRPSSGTLTEPAGNVTGPPQQATPWSVLRKTPGQLYGAVLSNIGRGAEAWREELQPDPNRTYGESSLTPWSWGTVDRSDPGHPALPGFLRSALTDILTPAPPGQIWGLTPDPNDPYGGSVSPGGALLMGAYGSKAFGGPRTPMPGWAATAAGAKNIASQWYRMASKLGGDLTPKFTDDFLDSVASSINPAREITTGPTDVSGLMSRWEDAYRGKPLKLDDVQAMDEGLSDLIDSHFDPKTGLDKTGEHLLDVQTMLRQRIAAAGPGDIVGSGAGFYSLNTARQAWSQAMKMSDLERINRRAQMTDNPSGSVITQVKNLITNHASSRGYDPDEMAALEDAASRGVIGGIMHRFGGRLWSMVGTAVGSHFGDAPGAVLGGIVGDVGSTAARNMATAIALRRMGRAFDVLGRRVPPDPARLAGWD